MNSSARLQTIEIRSVAEAPELVVGARELFREYERSLGIDLDFQGFAAELAGLPGAYGPPKGCLLVAVAADEPIGCVGLRGLDEHAAELKRLYVRPLCRGNGVGRELVARVLDVARELHYRHVVLDTLASMREAQKLYECFGFVDTDPYYENPLPGVRFMQLDLHSSTALDAEGIARVAEGGESRRRSRTQHGGRR